MSRRPIIMILHPVGIGATRSMNVMSTKLWVRALVDLLPEVVIDAAWLPYAEVAIDRERGLQDALVCAERDDAAVAVGGEFSRGMHDEWDLFRRLGRPCIDLTHSPMPGIMTYESYSETLTPSFKQAVREAFRPVMTMRAAA